MGVKAIHEITGKIAVVSEGNLAANPYLRVATDAEIKAEKEASQVRVFGHVLQEGLVPEVPEVPNEKWTRSRLVAYAAHKKIEVDESLTKAELLKALTEGA